MRAFAHQLQPRGHEQRRMVRIGHRNRHRLAAARMPIARGERHRIAPAGVARRGPAERAGHRIEARSEEHTSELQSLMRISYAVFCLKKTKLDNKQRCTPFIIYHTLESMICDTFR